MSGLPYPTPTRLRLADAIAAGHIRHYHWVNPQSIDTVRDVHVTWRLAELVAAGLAAFGEREDPVLSWSTAVLTPDGMAWVTRARTAEETKCERCNNRPPVSRCCSSHDKNLCHRCYRITHFVEVCAAKCEYCAREGLPKLLTGGSKIDIRGPVSTSPETGPGWVDESTGLVSGGLVAACSACGSLDHDRHPLGDEDYREPPHHDGEMEYVQPLRCTCPQPEHGTPENRGHLLGCPMLRAESTKDGTDER